MPHQELQATVESIKAIIPLSGPVGSDNNKLLKELSKNFYQSLDTFLNTIRNFKQEIPIAMFASTTQTAARKIEKQQYSVLEKYIIRTPEGVVGPMLPFLNSLLSAVESLHDIDNRLLNPLKLWCGKALMNPGDIDKAWIDKNISMVDVKKISDGLGKHFNDKVGDMISFASIHQVYPKSGDFKQSGDVMEKLLKISAEVQGKNITTKSEEINVLVRKLVAAQEQDEYMANMSGTTLIMLADRLYQAALEIELLSIVLFQIKIASVAYSESVEKINKEL